VLVHDWWIAYFSKNRAVTESSPYHQSLQFQKKLKLFIVFAFNRGGCFSASIAGLFLVVAGTVWNPVLMLGCLT
jgi:hypothetical protein